MPFRRVSCRHAGLLVDPTELTYMRENNQQALKVLPLIILLPSRGPRTTTSLHCRRTDGTRFTRQATRFPTTLLLVRRAKRVPELFPFGSYRS